MIARTSVSDTGIGMSQEYLTRIFEAFTREQNTTKSKIAGSGLGMSIVKKYVELLGGTINVESEPGKGSIFTVTLKHRIADEGYYKKMHVETPGTGSEILAGKNIHEYHIIGSRRHLFYPVYTLNAIFHTFCFKAETLEYCHCNLCIQIIVLCQKDIQMPKMDGYQATQEIRHLPDQDKACIPIVAMTANVFEEDKREADAAGMNGHIAKPIQADDLLPTLVEIIGQQAYK